MSTHDPTFKNQSQSTLKRLSSEAFFHESKHHAPEAGMAETVRAQDHAFVDTTQVGPLARLPPPSHPLNIAIGDWDELFRAVEERLTLIVGTRPAGTPEPQMRDTAGRIQVVVLECVSALDQLHTALTHERLRCHQLELELEVAEAKTAQAQMRAELLYKKGL
ncbi:hypothetical protein [Polaromonas sp. OV174]|uniref:hypothetical protein n=1 Tax=Polaromonas sp. OV174 TaxID=1855300 RepID=UPI000B849AEE|nr:hypothetical protein [Polaromonas sp. OV174]